MHIPVKNLTFFYFIVESTSIFDTCSNASQKLIRLKVFSLRNVFRNFYG